MAQDFTGAEFIKALAAGTLKDRIIREGMVKQNENDPNSILFAEGLDCTTWVLIPVKMIEKVEFIHNVPCKDHQHPYVRIHLKLPTDNPEAEVFSRLLTASSARHLRLTEGELAPIATGQPQQAVLGELVGSASLPYLQSPGNTEPGQSTCWRCTTKCMQIAIWTGNQPAFKTVCWTECRPIVCPM